MLERASVIDHDNTRAGTAQRRAELLQGYRFARPGLAEDCDIMVARRIFERTPEKWLAARPVSMGRGHLPTKNSPWKGCGVGYRVVRTVRIPLSSVEKGQGGKKVGTYVK